MDHTGLDARGWKRTRKTLFAMLGVLAAGGIFWAVWKGVEAPRGEAFVTMLGDVLCGIPPEQASEKSIGTAIMQNYTEYRNNAVRWSGTYHSCLFFSAALGAFAGLVLKSTFFLKNEDLKKDLAAFAAMLSALLITFSSVGDFQAHWQANRLAAGRMESLGYEFATTDKRNLPYFSSRIREISMGRNEEIVGSIDGSKQAEVPKH